MHGASTRDEKNMSNSVISELPGDVVREAYHLPFQHFTLSAGKKDQSNPRALL
jgi:hypothetical protein